MFPTLLLTRLAPAGLDQAAPPGEDEADLVAEARRSPAAFGELYRRYVTRVYRYIYCHVGEAHEAEDLTAQVFTAALEGIHRYQEQGNFAAWLFRIARNKTSDYYRRRKPQVSLEQAAELLQEDSDPHHHLEQGETLRRLAALLNRLDADQRELLRLRFAADLSFSEIAAALGRTEGAVKMATRRLISRLQVEWEAYDER